MIKSIMTTVGHRAIAGMTLMLMLMAHSSSPTYTHHHLVACDSDAHIIVFSYEPSPNAYPSMPCALSNLESASLPIKHLLQCCIHLF